MPALYFGAASDLAKKNPELARHYLDKGKLQYGKRTDRENNKTLEDAATYLITAYERLGEYSNAIAAAKDFVETTRILPESRSSAQAHGFLAHAYFMDRQFKPALEEAIHACKIYRQLKSNEVANLYYPELVDLTHTIKVIRLLKQSSYEALLKEGYRELSLGKKFYEQENEPGTASDVAGLIAQLSAKQKD